MKKTTKATCDLAQCSLSLKPTVQNPVLRLTAEALKPPPGLPRRAAAQCSLLRHKALLGDTGGHFWVAPDPQATPLASAGP